MIKLKLEIKEAARFFGNKTRVAEILGTTSGSISQWRNGLVPVNIAFRLAFIAKLPQFRRKGKMDYELIIE